MNEAQKELLTMLIEEAAEIIQICSKALRYGYSSYHPANETKNDKSRVTIRRTYDLLAVVDR